MTPPPTDLPDIASPSTFAARAQAWVLWLNTFYTELAAIIGLTIPAGSAAAGTLTGDTIAANVVKSSLFPYIYLREEQAANTAGGTFTQAAWQKRTINTEVNDAGAYASVASSVITLLAGTYRFRVRAPAFAVNNHKVRLANTSDGIYYYGSSEYADATNLGQTNSEVSGRFTIAATKNFEIQHWCQTTKATNGFGLPSNFAVAEVYAEIELWKEA